MILHSVQHTRPNQLIQFIVFLVTPTQINAISYMDQHPIICILSKDSLHSHPVIPNCPGVTFENAGCHKDGQKNPRPLSDMIFTDRDAKSPVYSGVKYLALSWNQYMQGLLCRCATKSMAKGFKAIGIQHYGKKQKLG